eukprot:4601605-Pyramimonas_sp.AAC.1
MPADAASRLEPAPRLQASTKPQGDGSVHEPKWLRGRRRRRRIFFFNLHASEGSRDLAQRQEQA